MNAGGRRFEDRVADLTVSEQHFAETTHNLAPPARSYVIVFTARSGSTWLTKLLSATNLLGHPEEYINPDFVRAVAEFLQSRQQASFLQSLMRRRKTDNGIFGIEVRETDVTLFCESFFFQAFSNKTIFFNLWRKNILAQAISLYRAVETKRFHSDEKTENFAPPPYDAEAIANWLAHIAAEENENLWMLRRNRPVFHNLCYENIVRDRNATIKMFADILKVELNIAQFAAPMAGELQKIGDAWNIQAEQRFRASHAEFLRNIEVARQIKQLIVPEGQG